MRHHTPPQLLISTTSSRPSGHLQETSTGTTSGTSSGSSARERMHAYRVVWVSHAQTSSCCKSLDHPPPRGTRLQITLATDGYFAS